MSFKQSPFPMLEGTSGHKSALKQTGGDIASNIGVGETDTAESDMASDDAIVDDEEKKEEETEEKKEGEGLKSSGTDRSGAFGGKIHQTR